MKALSHWRQYLGWTKVLFMVMMDHANLQYWKLPKNLMHCVAWWHMDLQEYDYEIPYIPGKENAPSDALSRQLGVDQGKEDNQGVTVIPPEKFNTATTTVMDKVLIPPLNKVKRGIMNLVHDHPSTGHPGCNETLRKTQE
jgi:hypothetical protein